MLVPRRSCSATVSFGASCTLWMMSRTAGAERGSLRGETRIAGYSSSDRPAKRVTMSPERMPARSAGPPGVTLSMRAPIESVAPARMSTTNPSEGRLARAWTRTPPPGGAVRSTLPVLTCAEAGAPASAAPSRTTATMLRIRSKPDIARPRHVHVHQRIQQPDPLAPELKQLALVHGSVALELRRLELLVHLGDAVLEHAGDAGGVPIHDPLARVVGLEDVLERTRTLLDRRELALGARLHGRRQSGHRQCRIGPDDGDPGQRGRERHGGEPGPPEHQAPALPAAAGLHGGPEVSRRRQRRQRPEAGRPLVQPLEPEIGRA